jgi:hypothetical protein
LEEFLILHDLDLSEEGVGLSEVRSAAALGRPTLAHQAVNVDAESVASERPGDADAVDATEVDGGLLPFDKTEGRRRGIFVCVCARSTRRRPRSRWLRRDPPAPPRQVSQNEVVEEGGAELVEVDDDGDACPTRRRLPPKPPPFFLGRLGGVCM